MHVMSIASLLLLLPVLRPNLWTSPTLFMILVALSALNFFAFIFLYRGFHRGIVSVVAPIAYSYPAITTVFAVLLLGVVLTETKILALAGVMLGVVLVSTRFSELRSYAQGKGLLKLTPGVGSAVLAANFVWGCLRGTRLHHSLRGVRFARALHQGTRLTLRLPFRTRIEAERRAESSQHNSRHRSNGNSGDCWAAIVQLWGLLRG